MEIITFPVGNILPQLTQVASVVNPKNTLVILNNVLVTVTMDGDITLLASDSENWLQMTAHNDRPFSSEHGEDVLATFCINANDLVKSLKALPNDMVVELSLDTDSHLATFKYTKGKFTLPYTETGEFPQPKEINEDDTENTTVRIVNTNVFRNAISRTAFATDNNELRPVMNGIHFDFGNTALVAAASDGHKLARFADYSVTHEEQGTPCFTLPKKPATVLSNILSGLDGDVKVAFDNNIVEFSNNLFKLSARLIEGTFPNYTAAIPTDAPYIVHIPKNDLLTAVRRVMPLGSQQSELIVFDFGLAQLTISAEDLDFSKSATETVDCDFGGQPLRMGFNGGILMEILRTITTDSVVMEISDPSRAAILYESDGLSKDQYLALQMPLLLNE